MNPLKRSFEGNNSPIPPTPKKPANQAKAYGLPKPSMNFWERSETDQVSEVDTTHITHVDPITPFKHTPQTKNLSIHSRTARNLFAEQPAAHNAPKKARKLVETDDSFLKIHQRLENQNKVFYNNTSHPVALIGRGSYLSVYQFAKKPTQVVKAYHGGTSHKFKVEQLKQLITHSLKNYDDIAALGLPVAELVNKETAVQNGFFVQVKISHPVDPKNHEQITQVACFFEKAVKHNVLMDLQPQNLRVTDDQKVLLIDFVEEPQKLHLLISKASRAWVELCHQKGVTLQEAETVLTTLTASFVGHSEPYTSEWLKNILHS